jgi:hypothetical protein
MLLGIPFNLKDQLLFWLCFLFTLLINFMNTS